MKRLAFIGLMFFLMAGCSSADSTSYKPSGVTFRYASNADVRNIIVRLEKIDAKLDRVLQQHP